jgi:hypothetical protein
LYNETAIKKRKNKTVKKLFSILLLLLFASASVLSGCDLVTLNEYKYYNTVVMEIGETEITKETLIQRFNNIGAQYVEDGYSFAQAMQITIDSMINRELILMHAKEELGELTQNQKNDVWQEVYDSVNERLQEFEGQIKAEWNVVYLNVEEEEEEKSYPTFSPYEKKVTMVEGEFVRVEQDEEQTEEPIGNFVRENFDGNIDWVATGKTYAELQQEAWKRYMRNLKNSESWKQLSVVDEEVFDRELNRLYEIFEGNKYVALLEENFNNNLAIDNNAITQKYIELVQDSFAKYAFVDELGNVSEAAMEAYHIAMGSDAKSVYYHPNSGNEYIYISHILIKYTDEQTAQIADIEARREQNEIDDVQMELELQAVYNQIAGFARDEDGKEVGEAILASDIKNEIETALLAGNTPEEKAQIFNNYIYKYNQDDGMFNAEEPYVVNLDTEVEDKMVAPFANASRALYQEGEGSMSDLVLSDFGYHIIFYSKPVENLVSYENLMNITPELLYESTISLAGDKSMYDKMYDTVNKRSYSNYQTGLINQMRSEVQVTLYESRYSDLLK